MNRPPNRNNRRELREGGLRYAFAQTLFYPTLGWNVLLGRTLQIRRWWDAVDDHVFIGAFPFASDVPRLVAAGVRGVVNTCREYRGPLPAYEAAGIKQLHIPTIDYQTPALADIRRAVEFIESHVAQGERTYIHCKAGRGRSAAVAMGWLMTQGMTPEEAQAHLLLKRPHVHRSLHRNPVVVEFWNALQQKSLSSVVDVANTLAHDLAGATRDALGRAGGP